MKVGKGVEWTAHSCALLALLPSGALLSGEALAEFIGVPSPYLAKQMQALSRVGIVLSKPGVAGGYRLARDADEISLWDITSAVEGTAPSFRCTEVRRQGPCGALASECARPCAIAAEFQKAETVYREALDAISLTSVVANIAEDAPLARKRRITAWINTTATKR
ncbi:MAG: Rrf2 family transcriptional regulator [Pseudomonadota bacterium]